MPLHKQFFSSLQIICSIYKHKTSMKVVKLKVFFINKSIKQSNMMKYTHVTRKTSCDRKYTSCDKRSICQRRIFSCEINNISCDRKFISCDRNKKEHLVSQYTFPVNERIFTVTGNEYPVTGRTMNTRI